jgi:hypothetical protein
MSKRSLGVLAIILILLMAVVATAGIDNLPRNLRQSAESAVSELASARQQFDKNRQAALAAVASDPSLFRSQDTQFRSRLDAAQAKLAAATESRTKLNALVEANRRQDREAVQSAVESIERARKEAVSESEAVLKQVRRWIDYKQRTPELLADLNARYQRLSNFDVETAAAPARKAMADWPEKRPDLERRIAAMNALVSRASEVQENTADARAKAEAKDYGSVDYGALIAGLTALEAAERDLKQNLETTNALAAQLYVGRDKVLLELDEDDPRRQRVRVVETKYADASLQNPQVSQTERWENIDDARFRELERAVDMVVERKPPGKYDSEAEKKVQAPAYAYVAPVGQSNQYGSWQNGVWHWLPQYLILSQLLRGPSYPPIGMGDYRNYDSYRRRGDTWYGRYGRTWGGGVARGGGSGIGGALRRTLENYSRGDDSGARSSSRPRERWTWGGRSGSFGGSRYQSRGSFGGSRYRSRPSTGGFGSRSYSRGMGRSFGRSFGRGRR